MPLVILLGGFDADQKRESRGRVQRHLKHFGGKMEECYCRRKEALWGEVSGWKGSLFAGNC